MTKAPSVQRIGVHDRDNAHSSSVHQQPVRLHTECDREHTDEVCHLLATHTFHQELKMNKVLLNGPGIDETYYHGKNLTKTISAIKY